MVQEQRRKQNNDLYVRFKQKSAQLSLIITSRVSGRGHRIGAACVCVSVSTLTTDPFDLRP